MKIGFFVKDFHNADKFSKTGMPVKSGAEFHAENQAKLLLENGHQVFLMAKKRKWSDKARECIDGLDLVRLHGAFRWLEILVRLATTHRNTNVLYILGQPWFAVWAIVWSKLTGTPIFLTLTSESEIFDRNHNWRTRLFSQCNGYFAISRAIRNGLIQRGLIDSSRIYLLPQGVDIRKYKPADDEEKTKLRENHGFSREQPIVLYCARVAINKGVDTLQTMWRIVHQQLPEAQLLVVGGGHYELLDQLKALGEETDHTVTVYGELSTVAEYYQMSDVYILPSRFEGLPTTLMEAISSGLPCVVSAIGGCEDLVFPDKNGYLVDPESPEGFARATIKVLTDLDERNRMRNFSRSFAERKLDSSVLMHRMIELFIAKITNGEH